MAIPCCLSWRRTRGSPLTAAPSGSDCWPSEGVMTCIGVGLRPASAKSRPGPWHPVLNSRQANAWCPTPAPGLVKAIVWARRLRSSSSHLRTVDKRAIGVKVVLGSSGLIYRSRRLNRGQLYTVSTPTTDAPPTQFSRTSEDRSMECLPGIIIATDQAHQQSESRVDNSS